jgi:hypothetical protein
MLRCSAKIPSSVSDIKDIKIENLAISQFGNCYHINLINKERQSSKTFDINLSKLSSAEFVKIFLTKS